MEFVELYKKSETHKILSLDLQGKTISHAYLIISKDEMLLDEFCMLAIKEMFCVDGSAPCGKCVNCLKIEHSNMVDFEIYPKDEKSLVVEDIEKIVESAYIRPIESEYKVFWLKNFDDCTPQGQNKILKTIEEPPHNVVFFLTAKNIGGVLSTILSRTKKIFEKSLQTKDVCQFLLDKKIGDAELISNMCDGNLSTAIKIAENKDAKDIINLAIDTITNLKSSKDVIVFSSRILQLKKDIPFFLDTMLAMFRDIAVYENSDSVYFKNLSKQYENLKKVYNSQMIEKISKLINEVYQKFEFNCNITGVIDQLLLNILEVKFLCQK